MKKDNCQKWVDPDFGPKNDDDVPGNIHALYTQNAKPVDIKIDPETGKPYPPEPLSAEE
jgi:hypothetical protein